MSALSNPTMIFISFIKFKLRQLGIAEIIIVPAFFVVFSTIFPVMALAQTAANVQDSEGFPKISQEPNQIVVGGDHNYPPYEFLNKDGQPDGYNTELTLAIAEVMGLDVRIELAPWSEVRQGLDDGNIDILQGMGYSVDRDKEYDFVPHHAIVNQSMFARKGRDYPTDFAQLKDQEVIVQRGGYTYDKMIERQIGATLIAVDTHVDALRLLSSGKHDFAIVANLPGLYVGKKLKLTNVQSGGKPFASFHYGHSVLQGNGALHAKFSEGLAILKQTGKHQEIYNKWLGSLENDGFSWKTISFISAGFMATLLLIMGFTIVWNRQLARTVSRRTQALETQQQQLVQADKMASLGVLISGVAHEINNPTGLLLINTPVIKESFADVEDILEKHYQQHGDFDMAGLKYSRMREEVPKMLDDMWDRANRIRRIVDDLRDYTQQSTPNMTQRLALNKLIETSVRIVRKTIQKSTDHFAIELAPNLPLFLGDAQRIEQVLINLIVNACQALTSEQQKIIIRTYLSTNRQQVCLDIIDNGSGISMDILSRITEPFFTTKRSSGGTGLGLSVSNSIIQEHNGQMHFESAVNQGTRATIRFPILKDSEV